MRVSGVEERGEGLRSGVCVGEGSRYLDVGSRGRSLGAQHAATKPGGWASSHGAWRLVLPRKRSMRLLPSGQGAPSSPSEPFGEKPRYPSVRGIGLGFTRALSAGDRYLRLCCACGGGDGPAFSGLR